MLLLGHVYETMSFVGSNLYLPSHLSEYPITSAYYNGSSSIPKFWWLNRNGQVESAPLWSGFVKAQVGWLCPEKASLLVTNRPASTQGTDWLSPKFAQSGSKFSTSQEKCMFCKYFCNNKYAQFFVGHLVPQFWATAKVGSHEITQRRQTPWRPQKGNCAVHWAQSIGSRRTGLPTGLHQE